MVDINTTPKARQGQYEETRENSYRDSLCIMCSDSLVSKHHHHFHCRICDRFYDVEGCPGGLSSMLPEGFELESHELTLLGRCAACA